MDLSCAVKCVTDGRLMSVILSNIFLKEGHRPAFFHSKLANPSTRLLFKKFFKELSSRLSEVRHLECYTQGTAFAGIWAPLSHEEGRSSCSSCPIVAIYSSFGTQLWCSLEGITDRYLPLHIYTIIL